MYLNEYSVDCALLAAGGTIDAVCAVCEGAAEGAAALVRPPGHHAECHCMMGFCIFSNAAVAIAAALARGVQRVLVVDWDVHHGNGTQNIFEKDKRVLFVSIHRHDKGTRGHAANLYARARARVPRRRERHYTVLRDACKSKVPNLLSLDEDEEIIFWQVLPARERRCPHVRRARGRGRLHSQRGVLLRDPLPRVGQHIRMCVFFSEKLTFPKPAL